MSRHPRQPSVTRDVGIFTMPIVFGVKKLFADGSAPHSYKPAKSRVSSTGRMVALHERAGQVKVGDTELDSPSDAEGGGASG